MTSRLRLMVDVEFNANGVSTEVLATNLRFIADHAYDEGLMTGDTDAEVISWKATVELIAIAD